TVCVVGKIRDLILQLSKSSIYSTKPLPATKTRCDAYTLLPLHGFSPEGFFSATQSTALYGKFRNTASFCDVYYTILFRKVTFTGELWLSQRRDFR
ncbi:hypothetical protein R1L03_22820, partial [Klebsiella sp. 97147]